MIRDSLKAAVAPGQIRVEQALLAHLPALELQLHQRASTVFGNVQPGQSKGSQAISACGTAAGTADAVERMGMLLTALHEQAIGQATLAVTGELGSLDRLAAATAPCPDSAATAVLLPEHCTTLAKDGICLAEQVFSDAEVAVLHEELTGMLSDGVLRPTFQECTSQVLCSHDFLRLYLHTDGVLT
eukprot:SAG31_NODE_5263_length_2644_cov_1.752849_2_plen_186_part_00